MTHFAIIGAGLSGVSLASRLVESGHQCTVFDKSRGLGGRLATRRMNNWQADHGAQYFTARSEGFKTEVERWIANGWVQRWDFEPWALKSHSPTRSPDTQVRYIGAPKMNAMVHGLSQNLDIKLQTHIDRLERENDGWYLWDIQSEQPMGPYEAVLITAPLTQALALLPVRWPALITAPMLPTWSFSMAFEGKTNIAANGLFSDSGIISWAAKDSSKPGRETDYETWVFHFASDWTFKNLEAEEDELRQHALELLADLTSEPLPNVVGQFKHRWLYARSSAPESDFPIWDDEHKIGLAGDWTAGGRLEDAWLSAMKLADKLT